MKRWSWGALALGTLSVAVAMAVAAQEPRQDQAQEPRTTDQPQRKGMMMRGRPMQGMMPMMMEMHRQHAAMESQWEATDAGIFVLRPGQLLKYDGDLKLVKTVDLPKMSPPMMPHHGDEADEAEGGKRWTGRDAADDGPDARGAADKARRDPRRRVRLAGRQPAEVQPRPGTPEAGRSARRPIHDVPDVRPNDGGPHARWPRRVGIHRGDARAFLSLIDCLLWQLASGPSSRLAHLEILEMPLTWSR